jgi:hypothetical protein
MRLAAVPCFVLASLAAAPSSAAQIFPCDGAEVRIEVIVRASPIWEERAEAVVTVSRDGAKTVLRYRSIDFIGGQCFTTGNSQPLVTFHANCGDSGCKDLANWGVIDPKTLRVLTVPSDSNREEAQKLIGSGMLPHLDMMSVLAEARKQGVEVP